MYCHNIIFKYILWLYNDEKINGVKYSIDIAEIWRT